MELIDQHTKAIMEGCKERARDAGLRFDAETLEYIVTNRDLLELSPKLMIPTLYDYWVHDVEVLKESGKYALYPSNPYETVINTRPAISFYNDNNPDWLNVMIFYHVLAHIDFFQNNLFFRHTWDDDFAGRALADKRMIARLRSEKGRWVDYVIEFTRGIDNLVGYHAELSRRFRPEPERQAARLDYYLDVFLQKDKDVTSSEYLKEVDRYNRCQADYGKLGEQMFFTEVERRHPEFEACYQRCRKLPDAARQDLIEYLMAHSPFIGRRQNAWMKSVMGVVRDTAMFFQPQIRTKILNEGWASYWHEKLFLQDKRIAGHEVDFARVNAAVTALPKVGLNPYALGMRLFQHIEAMADKGRISLDYERLGDREQRRAYDAGSGQGRKLLFKLRQDCCDFTFISGFLDQDFVDRHKLFVAGRRLNPQRQTWQYYVRSRSADAYRQMVIDTLYHPPRIEIEENPEPEGALCLNHRFEGQPLVTAFIANTLRGIAYLWGGPVALETTEPVDAAQAVALKGPAAEGSEPASWQRVRYTLRDGRLDRQRLE